jgi:hypothetical protein
MPNLTCPICEKDILDSQSRVVVWHENVRTCHRKCAATKYPDLFEDRPRPTGPLVG